MFLILTLIVLVAAFNIMSGLIMLVKDKGGDIAILRTIGATRLDHAVFLITGTAIGAVGTLIGLAARRFRSASMSNRIRQLISWLTSTELFSPELYFLSRLPADMDLARDRRRRADGAGPVAVSRPCIRPGGRRGSIRSRRCATNEHAFRFLPTRAQALEGRTPLPAGRLPTRSAQ